MYKIIGGDQKEYGPVSADQLRAWIAEGRVNASTMARPEGGGDWQPLSAYPEFAMALGLSATPLSSGGPQPSTPLQPEQALARDYTVDIGDCITRAWELLKANFWPIVGVGALMLIIMFAMNQLTGLITGPPLKRMIETQQFSVGPIALSMGVGFVVAPFYTLLTAGLFMYLLKLIRGEPATVGDAFSGFGPSTLQLLLLGWVQTLLIYVGMLFCILPGIYLAVCWYFAAPLVIDRGMGFWEAMEFSRKMVSKHWFLIFGLGLVAGLISFLGVIACCVGVFATMPLGLAMLMYAYEEMFGQKAR